MPGPDQAGCDLSRWSETPSGEDAGRRCSCRCTRGLRLVLYGQFPDGDRGLWLAAQCDLEGEAPRHMCLAGEEDTRPHAQQFCRHYGIPALPLDADQALSRLLSWEDPSDLAVVQHTVGRCRDEPALPSLSSTPHISAGLALGAIICCGRPDPQSHEAHKEQHEHSQTTAEQTPPGRSAAHPVTFCHGPSMPVPRRDRGSRVRAVTHFTPGSLAEHDQARSVGGGR